MKLRISDIEIIRAYQELKGRKFIIVQGDELEKRTVKQNNSLHLYCSLLADAFNEAGLDMKIVLKPDVDIEWNTESVKKYIWKSVQKAVLGTESTTVLKKQRDIDLVYDHINRHLSERFAEWIAPIAFPSLENQTKELTKKLSANYKPAEEPAF